MAQRSDDPAAVRRAAMELLARREHTRSELVAKLARRYPDAAAVAEQVEALTQENLQSDARFAAVFVRQRAERGYGPLRIRSELGARGLEADLVERAMDACDIDWPTVARGVLKKKFGTQPPGDFRERARRCRFLQYRGFNTGDSLALLDDDTSTLS